MPLHENFRAAFPHCSREEVQARRTQGVFGTRAFRRFLRKFFAGESDVEPAADFADEARIGVRRRAAFRVIEVQRENPWARFREVRPCEQQRRERIKSARARDRDRIAVCRRARDFRRRACFEAFPRIHCRERGDFLQKRLHAGTRRVVTLPESRRRRE